ncbi:urease accessory protein UreD [Zavarzinia sp. CC-PAN008]|uniref:urease accessory protein UreD n=1 Tax=Zavarzinia sp. CC-PAN008 TaxID=3243332 RepID=UPI003F7465C1
MRLGFKQRDGATVLADLYQQGSARVKLPRVERGEPQTGVLINTAGGLTGGDVQSVSVTWERGTRAVVTSQAAEKVYRARDGAARVDVTLNVGQDAQAEWLPQEAILFDRSALTRRTIVTLAPGACFLGVEMLVFGRAAHGETMRQGRVRDTWLIRRGNVPIYADVLALDGAVADRLDRPALGGGARALASLVMVAPDVAALLDPARAALANAGTTAAASVLDGVLVARVAAPDGASLRGTILGLLNVLRCGRPVPKVWRC